MKAYAIVREDGALALYTVFKYKSDALYALNTVKKEYREECAVEPELLELWVDDGLSSIMRDVSMVQKKEDKP